MKNSFAIVIFSLFIFLSPANAQRVVVSNSDEATYEISVDTIRQKIDYAQAWVESNEIDVGQKSKSKKSLIRFKCEAEEYAIASYVEYSRPYWQGDVISSNNSSYPEFSPVVPGSVAESFHRFVCGYLDKDPRALALVEEAIAGEMAAESAAAAADAAMSAEQKESP